jgi:hypothetical protein
MSADVGLCRQCHISESGMVESVGVAAGNASDIFRSKVISTSGFRSRHFLVLDVGRCQCYIRVGHGRKCGGSR